MKKWKISYFSRIIYKSDRDNSLSEDGEEEGRREGGGVEKNKAKVVQSLPFYILTRALY